MACCDLWILTDVCKLWQKDGCECKSVVTLTALVLALSCSLSSPIKPLTLAMSFYLAVTLLKYIPHTSKMMWFPGNIKFGNKVLCSPSWTWYIAKGDLELLVSLSPSFSCCNDRSLPPCGAGDQTHSFLHAGLHYINWLHPYFWITHQHCLLSHQWPCQLQECWLLSVHTCTPTHSHHTPQRDMAHAWKLINCVFKPSHFIITLKQWAGQSKTKPVV